jgi:hypothetical protein
MMADLMYEIVFVEINPTLALSLDVSNKCFVAALNAPEGD